MDFGELIKQYGWIAAIAIVFVGQYVINSGATQRTISIERKAVAKAQEDFSAAFIKSNEERRSLQAQINGLMSRFDKQEKINASLEAENKRLTEEGKERQDILNAQALKIEQLIAQGGKSILRIEELEKDLSTERAVTKTLRADLAKNNKLAQARIDQALKDVARVQAERDAERDGRKTDQETHRTEVKQLTERISALSGQVAELTKKVNGAVSDTGPLRPLPSA